MGTDQFLGINGLADALGVSRHAVYKWRARYPTGSAHPFPAPDVEVDGTPGWRPGRLAEVVRWRDGLPGRGAGGGRPSASSREFLAEAERRDFTPDEAQRMLAVFCAEYPEMTESEICAWLLDEWRSDRPSTLAPARP